ncbi:MAG TPA: GtrA family protein [Pseudonocardiaceae bacterium]|nr:GtrA family protein [Pseudonocardiaceae bacterium]
MPGRALSIRFSKFTVGSVVSTVVSQATLTGLYGWGHVNVTVASVIAVVLGAIPAFVINWKWTWGRDGKPALLREVLPYIAVIATGGLAAAGLTTLTDHVIAPLLTTSHAWRTVILDVVYMASYAILFVAKFALLNRIFAVRKLAKQQREGAPAGQGA